MERDWYSWNYDSDSLDLTMYFPSGIPLDQTIWKETDLNGYEEDFSTWEDEQRLTLDFSIYHNEDKPDDKIDEIVRCLACLNVD